EQFDRPGRGREVSGNDVEQRRLPRSVRPEYRPPLSGSDLEVDLPHSVEPTEAPADPPQAEGRPGAFGRRCCFCCCLRHSYRITPLTTGFSLPTHGRLRFWHGGCERPGGGDVCWNVPPNDWSTFGMYCTVLTSVLPGWAKTWYDHS